MLNMYACVIIRENTTQFICMFEQQEMAEAFNRLNGNKYTVVYTAASVHSWELIN